MAQPLMLMSGSMSGLTHAAVPPAQAEALYDAALENSTERERSPAASTAWPGEDWDEPSALPSPLLRLPSGNASGRFL